jgi:hypothetical protein
VADANLDPNRPTPAASIRRATEPEIPCPILGRAVVSEAQRDGLAEPKALLGVRPVDQHAAG